jgi:hypothetical protein
MNCAGLSDHVMAALERQHGLFAGASSGLSRSALQALCERGVLVRVAPGVFRAVGSAPTWRQQVMAATLVSPRALCIGATAAALHGIDGFVDGAAIHLATDRGGRNRLADRISQTLAVYPADDIVSIDGIACSGLARTVCDLASYEPSSYERAADDFQRRGARLLWLLRTAERLRCRGRPGPAMVIADVTSRLQGGTVRGSWFEAMVERLLHAPDLPSAARQYEVRAADGRFIARVDLAFPLLRLAVEAHSRAFHSGPTIEAFDQRRENELAAAGWLTVYVGWADAIGTPERAARQLARIARRRSSDLGVRLAS